MLKFLNINTLKVTIIISRKPLGIENEYVLDNVFSKELQTNYSGIYRTEEKIIQKPKKGNFNLLTNSWVHEDRSKIQDVVRNMIKIKIF